VSETSRGPHLTESGFDFLEDLEHRNEREWFLEHKATYETELTERMRRVAAAINVGLTEFAPGRVWQT